MAINVNQALGGGALRTSSPEELAGRRSANSKDTTAAVGASEQARAEAAAAPLPTPGPREPEPVQLDEAVEQANALAESALRARNRSVKFGRDDASGRITITIREEVNGEETTRQIPPPAFLEMVQRLKALNTEEEARGAFVDLDI